MLRSVLLAVHVGAGAAGLLVGPAAISAALQGRRGTRADHAYLVAATVLTATAVGLVALDPAGLWPFLLPAAGTQAAVVGGRSVDAGATQVRLVCGSYVSLVTALAVVRWGTLLAWVLPTLVGTALVEWAASSSRRRRPARTPSRSRTPSPRP